MQYKLINTIAQGSFGEVHKAISQDGNIVAIKILSQQYDSIEQVENLVETKIFKQLPKHPNCISLLDSYIDNDKVHLVYEYFPITLLQFITQNTPQNHLQLRNIMYSLLQGVLHIHNNGYVHRDLKPENILIRPLSDDLSVHQLKIIDFGNCKQVSNLPHSVYVSTRWYRAPEQLLQSSDYDQKIDIFAVACIACETLTGQPLFPGTSEIDQLAKIIEILGLPKSGSKFHSKIIQFFKVEIYSQFTFQRIKENLMIITQCNELLADLLVHMLEYDHNDRYSAFQCLQHQFFS